jgi:hypothetical protein
MHSADVPPLATTSFIQLCKMRLRTRLVGREQDSIGSAMRGSVTDMPIGPRYSGSDDKRQPCIRPSMRIKFRPMCIALT